MFGPKTPITAITRELRAFCDQTALNVLANYLEDDTHSPDLIITAEQKQRFLDLWASMVFVVGARFLQGKAERLCAAAMQTEVEYDPRQAEVQSIARALADRTTDSKQNVKDLLDTAFGATVFDHTKQRRGMPGVDLAMCVRAANHLASRVKF